MYRKGLLPLILISLIMGATAPSARAFYPHQWVFHDPSFYCYSMFNQHWFYMHPAGAHEVLMYDYATGLWHPMDSMVAGWAYYDWPHVYLMAQGRWFYLSPMSPAPCYNTLNGAWSVFGDAPYTIDDCEGIWKIKYIEPIDYVHDRVWNWLAFVSSGSLTADGFVGSTLHTGVTGQMIPILNTTLWIQMDGYGIMPYGVMNVSRTCVVGSYLNPDNTFANAFAWLKPPPSCTMADLSGRWVFSEVVTRDHATDYLLWQRRIIDIIPPSTASMRLYNDTGALIAGPVELDASINAAGDLQIDLGSGQTWTHAVDATKSVMAYTLYWSWGTHGFAVGVRQPASCSFNEMAGTWRGFRTYLQMRTHPDISFHTLAIKPSGGTSTTASLRSGESTYSRTLSNLQPTGSFSMAGPMVAPTGWQVSAGKDVMINTSPHTIGANTAAVVVYVKVPE